METIRDKRDLRLAYSNVHFVESLMDKLIDTEDARKYLRSEKRKIREINRLEALTPKEKCISYDFDEATILKEMPAWVKDRETAEAFFKEDEELHSYPSPYDCTRQQFTVSYKLVKRGDRWYVFHTIGRDV